MTRYPQLSIIIVSLNSDRTLGSCLNFIKLQTYPAIDEILLVDGGSTDNTLDIAKKSDLPIKIIHGGYTNNQEARRAIGIEKAKNEICAFIDTDNYIVQKTWLMDMINPLLEDEKIVASQSLRYSAPKNTTILNRYFGLFGAADPVAYYLGKADKLSWAFDQWNLPGTIIKEKNDYLTIEFDPDNYPTVGCNGIVFRRSILLKADWGLPDNYFHTDVFVDIAKKGLNRFAIVRNEIFHNTAEVSFLFFFGKRKAYMQQHYQGLYSQRRYKIFDPKKMQDIIGLLWFIIFTLTFIEPLYESIRGYVRKKDIAWFIHPVMCVGIGVVYAQVNISYLFKILIKRLRL